MREFVCVALLAFIARSLALKCYVCSSRSIGVDCNVTVSGMASEDCANSYCSSTKTTTSGVSVYDRKCVASCVEGTTNDTVETKCCQIDNCNGDFDEISSGSGSGSGSGLGGVWTIIYVTRSPSPGETTTQTPTSTPKLSPSPEKTTRRSPTFTPSSSSPSSPSSGGDKTPSATTQGPGKTTSAKTTSAPFQCYSCPVTSSSTCSDKAPCTVANPVCTILRVSVPLFGTTYTFGCQNRDLCKPDAFTECCTTSLCNSGAITVRATNSIVVAMVIAVFVSASARS